MGRVEREREREKNRERKGERPSRLWLGYKS